MDKVSSEVCPLLYKTIKNAQIQISKKKQKKTNQTFYKGFDIKS